MIFAYVDETGDRGSAIGASDLFAMCAVLIPDTSHDALRSTMARIKKTFGIPLDHPLHWNQHCAPSKKDYFDRRQYVASQLALVPNLLVNYVIFEKAAIPTKAAIAKDGVKFYNYVAGIVLERILLSTANSAFEDKRVQVRFGHVRGFDHNSTLEYFRIKQRNNTWSINYQLLYDAPRFIDARTNSGIQAADSYMGFLTAALRKNKYGQFQYHHLAAVKHQIRHSSEGRFWGYGMKVMAKPEFIDQYPWWKALGFDGNAS